MTDSGYLDAHDAARRLTLHVAVCQPRGFVAFTTLAAGSASRIGNSRSTDCLPADELPDPEILTAGGAVHKQTAQHPKAK